MDRSKDTGRHLLQKTRTKENEQLHSELYALILEKIMNGEYHPGQHLVEEDLASSFGVSRTPIREVLFSLERDGLIQRTRHRGAKVVNFTPDDVEEIYDIRIALERLAIKSAIRNLPLTDLLGLEHELAALNSEQVKDWSRRQAEIDLALHGLIVSHAGNRRLAAYLDKIAALIHSLRLIGYHDEQNARRAGNEHLEIVRALLRRDAELADTLLVSHLNTSKQNALDAFFHSHNVFSPEMRRKKD